MQFKFSQYQYQTDAADAVLPENNSAETVKEFEDACSTSQAT